MSPQEYLLLLFYLPPGDATHGAPPLSVEALQAALTMFRLMPIWSLTDWRRLQGRVALREGTSPADCIGTAGSWICL